MDKVITRDQATCPNCGELYVLIKGWTSSLLSEQNQYLYCSKKCVTQTIEKLGLKNE